MDPNQLTSYLRDWGQLTARVALINSNARRSNRVIELPCAQNLSAVKLPPCSNLITQITIPPSWGEVFNIGKTILNELEALYLQGEEEGFRVFPLPQELFNAYWQTPLYALNPDRPWQRVRVVIIGQDPYPQYDEMEDRPRAMGLSFSNMTGRNSSLLNIFKEIKQEYPNFNFDRSSNLTDWARQGVFLLNYSLVVIENSPDDERTINLCAGLFSTTLETISRHNPKCKYLLWGVKSQKAARRCLNKVSDKYFFESAHPSPLSANKGFFNTGHFRAINQQLAEEGEPEIIWG